MDDFEIVHFCFVRILKADILLTRKTNFPFLQEVEKIIFHWFLDFLQFRKSLDKQIENSSES